MWAVSDSAYAEPATKSDTEGLVHNRTSTPRQAPEQVALDIPARKSLEKESFRD